MTKSDWFEVIQAVGTVAVLWSSKYVNKAKKVIDEYDDLKKRITTLENSLAAAWKKIDTNKVPHGGEI